ncbi:MAG: DMT family transporter [Gemmatimonadaceae bacterium]|nr:DMT family transporter [Gemmatimonadaceae bacterium]
MKRRDLAALFLLGALWGGSFLFIRIAAPSLGAFPLAAGRVVLAALILWLGLRAAGRRVELRGRVRKLLVLGALNAAIPFSLIAVAELRLTASLAAMLNATVPLWASLFGAVWLGERLNARRVAGLGLGVVGVAVLVGWSPVTLDEPTLLSIAATLVATCAYGLSGVWTKRQLSGVPAPTLALGQQLGAATWLIVPALWQAPAAHPTRPAVLAVVALAVLSTTVAYLLYFHLVASIGPTRTTTVTYLLPVFGMLWGAIFLHEPLTRGMLAGLALILGSVVLVNEVRVSALLPPAWRTTKPARPRPPLETRTLECDA